MSLFVGQRVRQLSDDAKGGREGLVEGYQREKGTGKGTDLGDDRRKATEANWAGGNWAQSAGGDAILGENKCAKFFGKFVPKLVAVLAMATFADFSISVKCPFKQIKRGHSSPGGHSSFPPPLLSICSSVMS